MGVWDWFSTSNAGNSAPKPRRRRPMFGIFTPDRRIATELARLNGNLETIMGHVGATPVADDRAAQKAAREPSVSVPIDDEQLAIDEIMREMTEIEGKTFTRPDWVMGVMKPEEDGFDEFIDEITRLGSFHDH